MADKADIVSERAPQMLIYARDACGWVGEAEMAMVITRRRPDPLLLEEYLPAPPGQRTYS